jgi:hypothetical protein
MNPHYNSYISNKGLLWECDKEDVEVTGDYISRTYEHQK